MLSINSSKFFSSKIGSSALPKKLLLLSTFTTATTTKVSTAATTSSSSITSLGIFSKTRLLRDNTSKTSELAELNEEQEELKKQRQQNSSGENDQEDDELSTHVEEEEEQQPFDVVEATLQEIHDLTIAMNAHKRSSAFNKDAIDSWEKNRDNAGLVEYRSYRQWEQGHKLFEEWADKLEKLLTKDIMKAMIRSAEFFDLHQSQKSFGKIENLEELKSNPENFSGFSRHPLSYSAASGPEFKSPPRTAALSRFTDSPDATRRQLKYGTPNTYTDVQAKKEYFQKATAKFFMHGPYQIQIARPDASAELMSQSRCYRDRSTLRSLMSLVDERHHMVRQLPTKDRLRLIKIVSDVLIDDDDDSQEQTSQKAQQ